MFDSLIVGDCHIKENAIDELDSIFSEIVTYKAKKIINLGDYYHSNRPTGKELEFGTRWMKIFKERYEEVILLTGNHVQSHDGVSCVDYLKYMNIKIVANYKDNDRYYDHLMLNESELAFGTGKMTAKDLEKYEYVLLGHQHKFQQITPKIFHLGSIRRCDYGEAFNSDPKIAVFKDRQMEFITLKTPSKIVVCTHPNELKGLGSDSRVLYIFNSFEQFLEEVGEVNIQKSLFKEFKIKMNFKKDDKKYDQNENQSFKELFNKFIESLSPEVKKELEEIVAYEI